MLLSYIVCDNAAPDHTRDFAGDFAEEIIACAPLKGPKFRADARKVNQLLKNFLTAESAEQWIRPLAPRGNGRDDILELRRHYEGEGNQSRRMPPLTSTVKPCITRVNVRCPGKHSSTRCRRCSTSTRKRAKK